MVSLKDYAKSKKVSYEAVRKQVNRYREELGRHLIRDGKTQFLDEEGVAFLDEKRKSNPVIIMESDKDEQIEELRRVNDNLRVRVTELQDTLIKSLGEKNDLYKELADMKQQFIDSQKEMLLITQKQEDEIAKVRQEERERYAEREEYRKKNWWKFWRKEGEKTEEQ